MFHLFTGFYGIAVGVVVLAIVWLLAWWRLKSKGSSFDFDSLGEKGAFEKLHTIYLDIAKFVLGLAAGSIVLLVGSSALHAAKHLPSSFASPLFLLALSILYGILFMVFLTIDYEGYRHHPNSSSYPPFKYARNQALGFGSVFCFCVGYVWLIVIVTRPPS
jgi:hypothetical protein